MQTDYDITTKAKVKLLLGITGSSNDALLDMLIRQITGAIANEIDMYLKRVLYTAELYDGGKIDERPKQYLVLRAYPVSIDVEDVTVEFKGGTETVPVWTVLDPNYYTVDLKKGILYSHGGFIRGFQNMRVTYMAGYLIDFGNESDPLLHTLPFELTMLATEMVAKKFTLRNAQGISSETTEGQSITYSKTTSGGGSITELTKEQKDILASYVRHRI